MTGSILKHSAYNRLFEISAIAAVEKVKSYKAVNRLRL
jgi:hypothetical protein